MVNPFYVQPAQSDLTPVLQGIGSIAKQARETTQANAKQKAFMEAAQSGDPTQMTALVAKYPDLANAAKEQFGITNEASGAAALDTYQRVLSDPSRATEYLASGIEQVRAAGGRPDMMTSDLQMFQQDPETALQKIRMGYAMFGGDKKGKTDTSTAGMRDFNYYQDLKKTDPEAAAAFGRERGYLSDEGQELSVYMQKRLSESIDGAVKSQANAGKYSTLADEIEKANITGGFMSRWADTAKEVTGNQDAVSDLRRQYFGIRSSQAVSNLPPGVASDKDIELALKGFPSENANSEQMAAFLRSMSNLEQLNAEFNEFKTEYISRKGTERGMLKAWRDSLKKDAKAKDDEKEVDDATRNELTPEEQAELQALEAELGNR